MSELREWQSTAIGRFLQSSFNFLIVACPGAGKTLCALEGARRLMDLGKADFIIVVVPSIGIRDQWVEKAHQMGLELEKHYDKLTGEFHGLVVTYSMVLSNPALYQKLSRKALVILDEIHHCGDEPAWGRAIKDAFELTPHRLLLSGTPVRTSRDPIPFVYYDENSQYVAEGGHGYSYSYGEGIHDHVVRPIEFLALDGDVSWREAGATTAQKLADTSDDAIGKALSAAYLPEGKWIKSVLKKADEVLAQKRLYVPNVAGLLVAQDQFTAKKYVKILKKITGEKPSLVISDESGAAITLQEFKKADNGSRWIIAVQMVCEGIDIPRLAVVVYASKIRTRLFFTQAATRAVRVLNESDDFTATVFIPSLEPFLGYAREIEETVNEALRQEEEILRKEIGEPCVRQLSIVEPLDSSAASHHSTILSGDSFSDGELMQAENYSRAAGMPSSITPAQVARLLRVAGIIKQTVGNLTIEVSSDSLSDQKVKFKRLLKKKVSRYHYITQAPFEHIHAELNRMCGDDANSATMATLDRRLSILDKWIADARPES